MRVDMVIVCHFFCFDNGNKRGEIEELLILVVEKRKKKGRDVDDYKKNEIGV
jgi:hypothetical protein